MHVLITGANRGIGLALAQAHARRGDVVHAVVRRGSPELLSLQVQLHDGIDLGVTDAPTDLARRLGVPAVTRMAVGTDTVDEAEKLCLSVAKEFSRPTFFAGQVVFERETWLQKLLHNQTAYAIQRRLQWAGQNMVILPARA